MESIPTIDFNGLVLERVRLPQERTQEKVSIACGVLESSINRGSLKGCTLPLIVFTYSLSHAIPRQRVNEQNTQESTCNNNNNKVILFWLIKIKRTSLTWSSVFRDCYMISSFFSFSVCIWNKRNLKPKIEETQSKKKEMK